jgi:hypothetical protein
MDVVAKALQRRASVEDVDVTFVAEALRFEHRSCLQRVRVHFADRGACIVGQQCPVDQAAKLLRDSVAPAQRSAKAEHKAHAHTLSDGTPAHSFRTLLEEFSTIVCNTGAPGRPPQKRPHSRS